MKFLTEEQAFARLTSSKNVNAAFYADRTMKDSGGGGAFAGRFGIPLETKVLVHAHVAAGLKLDEVGDLFGISRHSVRAISQGMKQTDNGRFIPDQNLKSATKEVDETVKDKAVDLIMGALERVAPKFDDKENKLRDITGAAKDLAGIIDKISPKTAQGNTAAVILVGTVPYEENRYKTINVEAKVG